MGRVTSRHAARGSRNAGERYKSLEGGSGKTREGHVGAGAAGGVRRVLLRRQAAGDVLGAVGDVGGAVGAEGEGRASQEPGGDEAVPVGDDLVGRQVVA